MKIPKIIHQTWKTNDIPYDVYPKEWVDSWKHFHPDWEYRLWTDEDNRRLISEHYPDFLPVYDNYPADINRADAARYFILYHYGGLYVDLDFECLKSFDVLIDNQEMVLGRMDAGFFLRHSVPNALMASVPGHPFWIQLIKALPSYRKQSCVELATGPAMLFSELCLYLIYRFLCLKNKAPGSVKLYPTTYFYPITWKEGSLYHQQIMLEKIADIKARYPEAYAITYWRHAW